MPNSRFTVIIIVILLAIGAAIAFLQQFTFIFPQQNEGQLIAATSSLSAITLNKDEVSFLHSLVHKGEDIGQIVVKYTDSKHVIFSELYVVKKINGNYNILYKISQDGFFRFDGEEFQFDANKLGGFGGYRLVFLGNDFFLVQEISADKQTFSRLVSIYWNDKDQRFQSTFIVPKAVLDVINATTTNSADSHATK
jgi:hypothetical protein